MENLGKMERHEGHESPKMRLSTLDRELHEVVNNKETLSRAAEMFFDNVVDKILLGIVFDVHRKYKTNSLDPIAEEVPPEVPDEALSAEIFVPLKKKVPNCLCPKCGRLVGAARFALHLERCIKNSDSRTGTSGIAGNNSGKEKKSDTSYGNAANNASDDEYNYDWNWNDKRRKKKYKNSNKKKCNVKKTAETEAIEAMNVDVEGEDDYLLKILEIYSKILLKIALQVTQPPLKKKKNLPRIKKEATKTERAPTPTSM